VGLQHVASVGWTSWCGVAIEVLFSCGAMNAITDGVLFALPDALPEHPEEHGFYGLQQQRRQRDAAAC